MHALFLTNIRNIIYLCIAGGYGKSFIKELTSFSMKKHLLFVCSSNLDRSPAAASLFEGSKDYEAKSCGILPHAEVVISPALIEWADIIVCMEDKHKFHLLRNFRAFDKDIRVLEISNDFLRNVPKLLEELSGKLTEFI